jgi:hypothetical protein
MLMEVASLPMPALPPGFHEIAMENIHNAMAEESEHRPTLVKVRGKRHVFSSTQWHFMKYAGIAAAACFILISVAVAGLSGLTEWMSDDTAPTAPQVIEPRGIVPAAEVQGFDEPLAIGGFAFDDNLLADEYPGVWAAGAPLSPARVHLNMEMGRHTALEMSERFYQLEAEISLSVADLTTAVAQIRRLNGFSLHEQVAYYEYGGNAQLHRRVDAWAYEHVQMMLREMGMVQRESERAFRMTEQVRDLEARIRAITQEIDRLTLLMSESETLDDLIAIDRRLGQVETERERLRGNLNVLLDATAAPTITIFLHEPPPEPEPEEEVEEEEIPDPTFWEQFRDRFITSVNAFVRDMENVVVFLTRAFFPLVLVGLALLVAWRVYRRIRRRFVVEKKERDL